MNQINQTNVNPIQNFNDHPIIVKIILLRTKHFGMKFQSDILKLRRPIKKSITFTTLIQRTQVECN